MTRPTVDMDDDDLKEWLGITGTNPDVEKEVTYYTCLKMLSETIGKVPLKYYQETPKGRIRAGKADTQKSRNQKLPREKKQKKTKENKRKQKKTKGGIYDV